MENGNHTNAYTSEQPLQGNISEWVANQEVLGLKKRAEDRQVSEINRIAKEREKAVKDAQTKRYDSMKGPKPTGMGSIDQAYRMWIDQAMDKRLDLYKKEYSGQKLTPQEEALYQKLDNTPETLELMAKAYTEENSRYFDAVKKGDIKRDYDYELKMQKLSTSAIPFIDDDGNPVIGIDNDGDGKPDIISFDMNQGLSLKPKYTPEVDFEKTLKSFTDNIDTTKVVTDNNFVKTTKESVPLSLAKTGAKGLIYNRDNSLSPFTISQFYDAGIKDPNDITDQQLSEFENYVTKRILNSKKNVSERDVDNAGRTAASRESRLSKGDGKDEKNYTIYDLNHATDSKQFTATRDKEGNLIPQPGKDKKTVSNNYTGRVDIKRKVGSETEVFRNFGRDAKGNLTVTVDVATPKYSASQIESLTDNISDEDEKQRRIEELSTESSSITSKTYTSNGQAGQVMEFVKRFDDPKTNKPYTKIDQFKKDLPQFTEGGKKETPAERALRIANGGN